MMPGARAADATASPATAAATAFVALHRPAAEALGRRLGDLVGDPEAFAAELDAGLATLADPVLAAAMAWVAPGAQGVLGVRQPLIAAVERGAARGARGAGPAVLLAVAERAARSAVAESRWIAIRLMDRIVARDPERTWQLMRRSERAASDWVSVDTLASPYARGVVLEPYRWAEVEQLVYASSRWERRLAGSAVARIPFVDRTRGRRPEVATRGLGVVGSLIGDPEPDVQKALSWALRSLTIVDPEAVTGFCQEQADRAAATGDGARAWVVRDALAKLDAADAAAIRDRLAGIRRRPGAPSTSEAATEAARFTSVPWRDVRAAEPFP